MPSRKQAAPPLYAYFRALLAAYGPQQWWPAETALEMIVGAYLTQATSWRSVERSITQLQARGLLTVKGLRGISEHDLREAIRPSGFVVRKAQSLKAFIALLDARYGGSLESMAQMPAETLRLELLALPGVGPETADAILLYGLHKPVAVVDEYLRRVAVRHGIAAPKAKYDALQALADGAFALVPAAERLHELNEFHALIVEVGKRHCGTVPRCEGCPLAKFLPGYGPLPL
jgi:endonuclease-3 related protein